MEGRGWEGTGTDGWGSNIQCVHELDMLVLITHVLCFSVHRACMQAKEHVESNVGLAAAPQLTPRLWQMVHKQMQEALAKQRVS